MSDRESRKKELLKELGDVQSLLDDAETIAPADTAPGNADREQIRKLASERANPFLGTPLPPRQAPASTAVPAAPPPERPSLSSADIDAVIDDLVAEAMPKLEKALRLKLRAALRRKS
ncbi:MAG: hypothetical protein VX793_07925 [Pseudomonadota bacterium]|nr:hypothetical protein [Pseudomonadota bacterium]